MSRRRSFKPEMMYVFDVSEASMFSKSDVTLGPFTCSFRVVIIPPCRLTLCVDDFKATDKRTMRRDYSITFSMLMSDKVTGKSIWGRWYSNANKVESRKTYWVPRAEPKSLQDYTDIQIHVTVSGPPIHQNVKVDMPAVCKPTMVESLSDISFECSDGVVVQGHKVLLSRISPVFLAMFTSDFNDEPSITLPDVDSVTMKRIIDMAFDGSMDQTLDPCDVDYVLTCDKYIIADVVDLWCLMAMESINKRTAVILMRVAIILGKKAVKNATVHYIKNHTTVEHLEDLEKSELLEILKL